MPEQPVFGTKEEQKLFHEASHHYQMAKEDLEVRIADFDKKDILFRSYIDKNKWPYRSIVFDPRVFTGLFEKTFRLLANKPRGRLVPREGGDSLGAKINNELLSFQWDDNERVDAMPMLAKWAMMDLNARKYGASFGLAKWHWQRQVLRDDREKSNGKSVIFFDGPNFKPLNNRDCLPNPSYSTIKNWFQHRDYLTLQEMSDVNDSARAKPIYKNLDILRMLIKEEAKTGGDTRESNWTSKNKSIKGLQDYLGRDEVYKTVEIITEYRPERWITFSPKHGVILRDIANPYQHGQIPVILLKYYPIDEDIYGLSEIEPIEKLQKATNALVCQYLDAINLSTYPIVKVRSTGGAVQMHTLEFKAGAKWLMNDPSTDVLPYSQTNPSGVGEFASTYRFMIGAMQEGLGETSAAISNLNPQESQKTATEIRDLAITRSARDNFNQLFLGEAIKKQEMFWYKMDQQLLFQKPADQQKVIRIVGKDAIKYFQNVGLDGEGLTDKNIDLLTSVTESGANVDPRDLVEPLYPVKVGNNIIPKFNVEEDGQFGSLILEPEDLSGNYDFIPDIESMRLPDDQQILAAKKQMIELALNPLTYQLLAQEQYKLKVKEVLEDFFEQLGMKDADKYFEKIQNLQEGGLNGQVPLNNTGAVGIEGSLQGVANVGNGGMGAGIQAVA